MDGHRPSVRLLLVVLLFLTWLDQAVVAMRPDRMARLRREAVDMFYHGYDNYMELAFPEDEVCREPVPHLLAACPCARLWDDLDADAPLAPPS